MTFVHENEEHGCHDWGVFVSASDVSAYYYYLIDHYGEEIRRFKRENPEYTFYQAMLYIKSKYGFPNSNQSIHESRKK